MRSQYLCRCSRPAKLVIVWRVQLSTERVCVRETNLSLDELATLRAYFIYGIEWIKQIRICPNTLCKVVSLLTSWLLIDEIEEILTTQPGLIAEWLAWTPELLQFERFAAHRSAGLKTVAASHKLVHELQTSDAARILQELVVMAHDDAPPTERAENPQKRRRTSDDTPDA